MHFCLFKSTLFNGVFLILNKKSIQFTIVRYKPKIRLYDKENTNILLSRGYKWVIGIIPGFIGIAFD